MNPPDGSFQEGLNFSSKIRKGRSYMWWLSDAPVPRYGHLFSKWFLPLKIITRLYTSLYFPNGASDNVQMYHRPSLKLTVAVNGQIPQVPPKHTYQIGWFFCICSYKISEILRYKHGAQMVNSMYLTMWIGDWNWIIKRLKENPSSSPAYSAKILSNVTVITKIYSSCRKEFSRIHTIIQIFSTILWTRNEKLV